MQVKDLEVYGFYGRTEASTANCYGGTGVHGPYCRQTAIKLVLYSGLYHCAKTLLYDSVFYSVYLNIHLKYTHQRIEPYTQVRIFKYNRSRDICGCLANR